MCRPVPGGLVDFGLYFFHNAKKLCAKGTAPYFYLPKMENHLEARLWNDVFLFVQESIGLPRGTIRATALLETLPAAFEMDEILYELREHSAGLNCGRWDYVFSYIKCFRKNSDHVLPDREQVTMTVPFLRSYSQLLIKTCHRRGIHAMGGKSTQIPDKDAPQADAAALQRVRADKEREAIDGFDGTWISHPWLVPVALEAFGKHMKAPNQITRLCEDINVTAADLVRAPQGTITLAGLKSNIAVGVRYVESWLRGEGSVPLYGLVEDAATAEIARAQIWQWIHYPCGKLENGQKITAKFVRELLNAELMSLQAQLGNAYKAYKFEEAAQLFDRMSTSAVLAPFLTTEAYEFLS
jgi:malate synthase